MLRTFYHTVKISKLSECFRKETLSKNRQLYIIYFSSSHRSDISIGSRRGVGTVDVGALALSGAASPSGAGSPKPGVYINDETQTEPRK